MLPLSDTRWRLGAARFCRCDDRTVSAIRTALPKGRVCASPDSASEWLSNHLRQTQRKKPFGREHAPLLEQACRARLDSIGRHPFSSVRRRGHPPLSSARASVLRSMPIGEGGRRPQGAACAEVGRLFTLNSRHADPQTAFVPAYPLCMSWRQQGHCLRVGCTSRAEPSGELRLGFVMTRVQGSPFTHAPQHALSERGDFSAAFVAVLVALSLESVAWCAVWGAVPGATASSRHRRC